MNKIINSPIVAALWISEIKALDSGDSIAIKGRRYLRGYETDEELDALKFDNVKIRITAFEIIEK